MWMAESALKVEDPRLVRLPCVNDALLSAPVWEERRPKNWLAIIDIDGTKPGGLDRKFMPSGRGETYYIVEQLSVFDPVEFGADRIAWSGNQVKNRWYGVVVEKTDTYLLVEPVESGAQAVLVSKERKAGIPLPPPPPPRVVPLPPPPPTEEELQGWAEALQQAVNLMVPPKQKRAKECMHEYLEAMSDRDYVKAADALARSLCYRSQPAQCTKLVDDIVATIRRRVRP
jgi:hypothetical protein